MVYNYRVGFDYLVISKKEDLSGYCSKSFNYHTKYTNDQ